MTQKQEQKSDDDDVKVKPQEKAQAAVNPMAVGPREVEGHPELPPGHGNFSINEPPGSDVGGEAATPPAADPPVIEALDPDEVEIGSADTILHVHGTGFTAESIIHFAGQDEPTTMVSETELTTGLKPSLWADGVVVQCSVKNGAVTSEEVEFEFLDPISRTSKRTKPPAKKKR